MEKKIFKGFFFLQYMGMEAIFVMRTAYFSINFHSVYVGGRGGSVVERRAPEREVQGSNQTTVRHVMSLSKTLKALQCTGKYPGSSGFIPTYRDVKH